MSGVVRRPIPPTEVEAMAATDVGQLMHANHIGDRADPYAVATAEFYDLLATEHWKQFGPELAHLLGDADPANGPIVDVGAGTGVGLSYLRDAVPGAAILAIEPSKAMRTALHTRLTIDGSLRAVTTVDPRPLDHAALPSQACALVLSAVLGHFDDDQRNMLWRTIADVLPPGAPAVVEVLPPGRALAVPPTRYRALPVGDHVYEGWQEGVPLDERTMRWTMTYRVIAGDDTVAEYRVESDWRCCSVGDVRSETRRFGLDVADHGDVVVVRRDR